MEKPYEYFFSMKTFQHALLQQTEQHLRYKDGILGLPIKHTKHFKMVTISLRFHSDRSDEQFY